MKKNRDKIQGLIDSNKVPAIQDPISSCFNKWDLCIWLICAQVGGNASANKLVQTTSKLLETWDTLVAPLKKKKDSDDPSGADKANAKKGGRK